MLAGVISAVVIISLLVAKVTGSLGIPQNDDWSYSKTALSLASTGQLHLQGWGSMFLLGQVFTAVPFLFLFGRDETSLRLYGEAAAVLMLVCTYLIARRCTTPRRAVSLVAVVAVFPGFGLLAASYMTDLPAAGAALLSIVLGAHAVRLRSLTWFAAALLAGLWAFTIREQMVAAPVAVGVSAVVTAGLTRRFRIGAAGLTGLMLIVCAALEHLRRLMPSADVSRWNLSRLHLWMPLTLIPAYLTIALVVMPLSVWAVLGLRRHDLANPGRVIGWATGIIAVAYAARTYPVMSALPVRYRYVQLTLHNYLNPLGAYRNEVVGRPHVIFGAAVWLLLQGLAAIGGVLLAGELGAALNHPPGLLRSARRWDPALMQTTLFGLLMAAGTVVLCLGSQPQLDRYFVVVVPCAGIVLLRRARPMTAANGVPAIAVAAAAALLLGVVSWDITWSTDERDSIVWVAAQDLVQQGVNPRQINAGLAWDGMHAIHPANNRPVPQLAYLGEKWTWRFRGESDCWIITLKRLGHLRAQLVGKRSIGPYGLQFASIPVYIMHRSGCPNRTPPQPRAADPPPASTYAGQRIPRSSNTGNDYVERATLDWVTWFSTERS